MSGLAKYIEGRLAVPVALFHVLDLVVSGLVITALFSMIFKILPDLSRSPGMTLGGSSLDRNLIHRREIHNRFLYREKRLGVSLRDSGVSGNRSNVDLLFCFDSIFRR